MSLCCGGRLWWRVGSETSSETRQPWLATLLPPSRIAIVPLSDIVIYFVKFYWRVCLIYCAGLCWGVDRSSFNWTCWIVRGRGVSMNCASIPSRTIRFLRPIRVAECDVNSIWRFKLFPSEDHQTARRLIGYRLLKSESNSLLLKLIFI